MCVQVGMAPLGGECVWSINYVFVQIGVAPWVCSVHVDMVRVDVPAFWVIKVTN